MFLNAFTCHPVARSSDAFDALLGPWDRVVTQPSSAVGPRFEATYDNGAYHATLPVVGIDPARLRLSVQKSRIIVSCEAPKKKNHTTDEQPHQNTNGQEELCLWRARFDLPFVIAPQDVSATCRLGQLHVIVREPEAAVAKEISIVAG